MFKTLLRPLAFTLVFACALAAARAQSIRWQPDSGTLAFNQLSDLTLVFEQCEPKGTVALPDVAGLQFGGRPSTSENHSFTVIKGKAARARTVTHTYRVRPTERRPFTIPEFTVQTDQGPLTVAAVTFEVGDATIGQSLPLDKIAQSRFTLPTRDVWAGEVFPLTYSLNVARRHFYQLGSDLDWNPAPFTIENWAKPELIEAVINNEQRVSILYKTRAYAKAPGAVTLQPASQLVNLTTGSTGFNVFARTTLEQFTLTSQPASLTVNPLPAPAPAAFFGAVGQFTLDSRVVPASATVGEPITWTLTLEGTGNWPDIAGLPPRSVSKDFRVVQPQAKRTNKDNALFDASIAEDVVLIPTKPGTYTLGPVTYAAFDPATGSYQTLTTRPVTVTVTVAPAAGQSAASAPPTAPDDSDPSAPPSSRPAATGGTPAAPAALPRDPLPPAGPSIAPFTNTTVVVAALAAFVLPLALWIALALRRARVTDPARPLREARIRLSDTLRELAALHASAETPPADAPAPASADTQARTRLLIQRWQRDTALLFRLPQAVPTPASFADLRAANTGAWADLWAEADRSLYSDAPLPADWTHRANQALVAHRPPAFSVFQLLLPRNLLPLLALLATLVAAPDTTAASASSSPDLKLKLSPSTATGEAGGSSDLKLKPSTSTATGEAGGYSAGDFAAAETAWTRALKTTPTDWTAHHNLALALIQQDRPAEAAGHALAAFVQRPDHSSVRWHLDYAFATAGVSPAPLKPFLSEAPAATLARLASPTRWQALLIVSAWLLAATVALGLHGAYHQRPRTPLLVTLLSLSLLGMATALVSLRTYGPLAHNRAVMVVKATDLRSIPTDLDTPQKSTPLAVGVVALADQTFLGWQRLAFPDGKTGWARTETLVPLWRSPEKLTAY